jgi:hypothetical protein
VGHGLGSVFVGKRAVRMRAGKRLSDDVGAIVFSGVSFVRNVSLPFIMHPFIHSKKATILGYTNASWISCETSGYRHFRPRATRSVATPVAIDLRLMIGRISPT